MPSLMGVYLSQPQGIITWVTRVQADMRQYSTVLGLLIAAAAMAAEEVTPPVNDPAVLQRLLEVQRSVTTMTGTFIQTTVRTDDPEGGGTVYLGRVDLQAQNKYNLVYRSPKDTESSLRHCSDGVTRWHIDQMFADQAPDVSAKPVAGGAGGVGGAGGAGGNGNVDVVGRIAALLRGDRAAVLKDFTVVATAVEKGFTLLMTPKPGELTEHLIKVEADLDAVGHVTALRFFDRQGNRVTIVVSDAIYNQPVPPETFTYTAP